MKHAYEVLLSFHYKSDRVVDTMLREMQRFTHVLERLSPNLNNWLLAGETKREALLYEVFKEGEPTTAAKAVLEHGLKNSGEPRFITVWNGREKHEGASLQLMAGPAEQISLLTFVGRPKSFSSDWRLVAEALAAGVAIWPADYARVESNGYNERKTFKDRPGVGWMLYLPRVLTVQQVPEARALVPIMGKDDKGMDNQVGTIIVSVTDEPFSDENPEHVKIANAIEIRLVDQDLLPRYAEL